MDPLQQDGGGGATAAGSSGGSAELLELDAEALDLVRPRGLLERVPEASLSALLASRRSFSADSCLHGFV